MRPSIYLAGAVTGSDWRADILGERSGEEIRTNLDVCLADIVDTLRRASAKARHEDWEAWRKERLTTRL